jgi:predicted aldo/keto reductase-like oxidoreductase
MMQTSASSGIPLRQFGNTDANISALGMGGHHLGDAPDEATAMRMVHEAVDGGITFLKIIYLTQITISATLC